MEAKRKGKGRGRQGNTKGKRRETPRRGEREEAKEEQSVRLGEGSLMCGWVFPHKYIYIIYHNKLILYVSRGSASKKSVHIV